MTQLGVSTPFLPPINDLATLSFFLSRRAAPISIFKPPLFEKMDEENGFKSIDDDDEDVLPVVEFKDSLIEKIMSNQILICVGETGSGKTTQIPQFCLDSGLLNGKIMAITQPRRVAAMTVVGITLDVFIFHSESDLD